MDKPPPKFDVALSFAGEDRDYVDRVAHLLRQQGVAVFYDQFEEADLWGKDLYAHLSDTYRNQARYTVMFISAAYGKKLWTNHERSAAQARAFQEAQEYILPARFDDTEIPGVLPTTGYVSLKGRSPEELVSLITKKLVSSGGTVPTELVRRDFSTVRQRDRPDPTEMSVEVLEDEGKPIPGCSVVALADNGTTINASTNDAGVATLKVVTRRHYTVLIAHPDFPAAYLERLDPAETISVTLPRTENVGSCVIHGTGHIPGLKGRLNPILDTSNRTYLYANNIAINGGKNQPVNFAIDVPFELEDADGVMVVATVKLISVGTALVQYLRP